MMLPLRRHRAACVVALASVLLVGCSKERRVVDVEQPSTPPADGTADPRMPQYLHNAYRIAQGGRYFVWYGCAGCHDGKPGHAVDLAVGPWRHGRSFHDVFEFIAHGHPPPSEGPRIPIEQDWEITAYIADLPNVEPEARFRQANDLAREPATRPASASAGPGS